MQSILTQSLFLKKKKRAAAAADVREPRVYLVGGGIASLAAAVYLIRDGKIPGRTIHILEKSEIPGGSLDGSGFAESGYIVRGGRMFEEHYGCTFDLLSSIPSLQDPKKTVLDEIVAFNKTCRTYAKARLVSGGKISDISGLGISKEDQQEFRSLLMTTEKKLETSRISDIFSPQFFTTNFWFFYCTTFAFQSWHSALEFKRYLLRFIHLFPGDGIRHLTGVWRTPYNQYDSVVRPVTAWLSSCGVEFRYSCEVTDVGIKTTGTKKIAELIRYRSPGGSIHDLALGPDDRVIVTNGSMTAGSRTGSMNEAPALAPDTGDGAWALWEKLAQDRPEFGRPAVFDGNVNESKWESFTVTFHDPVFFKRMEEFTGNAAGTGGLVTFTDSNWLMSVVLAHQPHFIGQPDDVQVCWGYGLFVDKPGNFVQKPMAECTGREILEELLFHLHFDADREKILASAICIPCMMPFITSQFLVRTGTDRPKVVPDGCMNLAFIGQFCEIPDDVVFTVEYSVRSAQVAVYTLLGLDREPVPVYKGWHNPAILYAAWKTLGS
ncbi:MAG: oleate hydratase [Methanoregula sp.]|jgi:oleate hydratase